MTTPDLPNWLPNDHSDLPVRVNPNGLPPDTTTPASPPAETQIKPPEDLVSVDDTGNVEDDVLPPPRVEDFGTTAPPPMSEGKGAPDARDNTPDDARKPLSPPEQPLSGTDTEDGHDVPPDTSNQDQNGGGGGKPPDAPSGENDESEDDTKAVSEATQACVDDIHRTYERVVKTSLTPDDTKTINDMFIVLAPITKDVEVARRHANLLVDPTVEDIVAMHFGQHEGGDEEALPALRQRVEEEGSEAHAWKELVESHPLPADQKTPPPDINQVSITPLLDATLKECESHNIPPGQWIEASLKDIEDETAREEAYRQRFLQHASQIAPGSDYAKSIEAEVNLLACKVATENILEEGPDAIRAATYPGIKQMLIDNYRYAYGAVIGRADHARLTDLTKGFFDIASSTLRDPSADSSMLRKVDSLADETQRALNYAEHRALPHRGEPIAAETMMTFRQQLGEWKVGYGIRTGSSVVAIINACVMQAEQCDGRISQNHMLDHLLTKGAQEYTKRGDITSAVRLAQNASGSEEEFAILRACWPETTTSDQLIQFALGYQEVLGVRSEAPRDYNFQLCLRTENTNLVEHLVLNYMNKEDYPLPSSHTATEATHELLSHLYDVDPEEAVRFADGIVRQALAEQKEMSIQSLQPFYDTLAKSNDPRHLSLVRASIRLAPDPDTAILRALTHFARTLRMRLQPNNNNVTMENGH